MFATATECSRAPARHRGGSLATPVSVYGRQLVRLGQESLSRAVLVVRWSMNRHIHVSVLEAVIGFHRLAKSEEHTSELQSRGHLVCRLLLEKKNTRLPSLVALSC